MDHGKVIEDVYWWCPLLKRQIAEGHCLDINYQRMKYFKPDVLTEAQEETGLSIAEISGVCENCPNLPLPKEDS